MHSFFGFWEKYKSLAISFKSPFAAFCSPQIRKLSVFQQWRSYKFCQFPGFEIPVFCESMQLNCISQLKRKSHFQYVPVRADRLLLLCHCTKPDKAWRETGAYDRFEKDFFISPNLSISTFFCSDLSSRDTRKKVIFVDHKTHQGSRSKVSAARRIRLF